MKDSLRTLNVANQKNLRISQSKVRAASELSPPTLSQNPSSLTNLSSFSPQQDTKEARQRLIEQNRRLKKQALQLAERMDQILSQEKFKRKYGVGVGDEPDQETQLKRLQARRQEQKIQEMRTEITLLKRENVFVHDQGEVIEKQNAIRALQGELKTLQAEKTSFLNVRKEQTKALLFRSDEKYTQKIEKSKAQLAKIKEQCKTLFAKTAENEKLLMKTHQKTVTKNKRLKDIQEKIRQNKEKMKKGNNNVVTIEMIAEIESEIMKLEAEHKESQRMWLEKLSNLEAECANRRLEEEKKLIILRDKEKEVRLNDIRLKQFKKLIIQNKAQKKEAEEQPTKEYRSRRNIKYFQRELS